VCINYYFLILYLFSAVSFFEVKESYHELLSDIQCSQKEFSAKANSNNPLDRQKVIDDAREYLVATTSHDLFPHWYGTPWDFNGTSRIPGEGKIACGYFITNVLTDLGFKIPRIKWAQSASEIFIKKLVPEKHIKRFSNRPIEKLKSYLIESGDGLYLVGMDMHTGFLLVQGKKVQFVHASYYYPETGVLSEAILSQNPLSDSAYVVVGKLLTDEMMEHWLNGYQYPI